MNWMFESRSKDYDYDEDTNGNSSSPPTPWYTWLLLPIFIILVMLGSAFLPILVVAGAILRPCYATAKYSYESGELEYPRLAFTGGIAAILLYFLISNHLFNISDHPFITFCVAVFIFLCTLAPLAGLALRFIRQFITFLEQLSSITLSLLFLGTALGIIAVYLAPSISEPLNAQVDHWKYERESETTDDFAIGQTIQRTNASGSNVHGQFGSIGNPPWSAEFGYVRYTGIKIAQVEQLHLQLRYSKNSPATTDILVYLDDERTPRAAFRPVNQQDWNTFAWTEPIQLGPIEAGIHKITFLTHGQNYGVADLDMFVLSAGEK